MSSPSRAFTIKASGLLSKLTTRVKVFTDINSTQDIALWDTGATACCISKELAQTLELKPMGFSFIHTPSGVSRVKNYLINIELPDNVIFKDIRVTESEIGLQKLGLLIGMNIISLGDFAVCNKGGKTSFTFRIPSQERVDFVTKERMRRLVGKPHGHGKK